MSTPSSWKNAIPRRMYRERRQLKSREHLGLLEKKRDYKRRAKDYHSKENVISKLLLWLIFIEKLSEKARQRNPDEFYHKMVNATIKDGEHHTIEQGGKDAQKRRKIEENQDIALVGLKRMVEHKKADKL